MNQPSAAPTRKVTAAAGGTFVAMVVGLVGAGVHPTIAVAAAVVLTLAAMVPAYLRQERSPY